MNWNIILTTVGLLTTLVLFVPIFMVYVLGFHRGRMAIDLEMLDKHQSMIHKSGDDINWEQIFEGENK